MDSFVLIDFLCLDFGAPLSSDGELLQLMFEGHSQWCSGDHVILGSDAGPM